jgi:hypothetical protein
MRSHVLPGGIAAAALAGALVFAGATAASAGPPNVTGSSSAGTLAAPNCQSGRTCLWPSANFKGTAYFFQSNYADFSRLASVAGCTHTGFNDCVSSAYNDGQSCTVYLRKSINYKGDYHSLSLGDWIVNFGSSSGPPQGYGDPSFNDSVSSLSWCNPNGN